MASERALRQYVAHTAVVIQVIIQCHVDRFHLSIDGAHPLEVVNWVGDPQSITALTIGDTLLLRDVRLM